LLKYDFLTVYVGEKFDTITGWTRAARVEITVVICEDTIQSDLFLHLVLVYY